MSMTEPKQHRGFATLTPEQRRAISTKGGKAAQAKGTAHRWTSEEAQTAGRKGGSAPRAVVGEADVSVPATERDA